MSTTFSRSNAMLAAILVTALLAGTLFISTASAQDTPVDPPTANSGIMTGAADYPLHAGGWMSDTITTAPGRQTDAHGAMGAHPAGAAMGGPRAGAMSGHMMGSMAGRHTASGATVTGHPHNRAPVMNHQGANDAGAGMAMQGADLDHMNDFPCTDCH